MKTADEVIQNENTSMVEGMAVLSTEQYSMLEDLMKVIKPLKSLDSKELEVVKKILNNFLDGSRVIKKYFQVELNKYYKLNN